MKVYSLSVIGISLVIVLVVARAFELGLRQFAIASRESRRVTVSRARVTASESCFFVWTSSFTTFPGTNYMPFQQVHTCDCFLRAACAGLLCCSGERLEVGASLTHASDLDRLSS